MSRALIEQVLLFLVPFALFALWLVIRRRKPFAWIHWSGNVPWLVIAGLLLSFGWLVWLGLTAPRGHGDYVPAHMENGVFVPARTK